MSEIRGGPPASARRCDWCGALIEDGRPGVAITHHVERFARTWRYPDGVVDVLSAVVALEVCAWCGVGIDADRLRCLLIDARGILCPPAGRQSAAVPDCPGTSARRKRLLH